MQFSVWNFGIMLSSYLSLISFNYFFSQLCNCGEIVQYEIESHQGWREFFVWLVKLNASQIGRSSSHPCTACYGCRSDPCTACYGSRSGPLQLHAMAGQTPVCTPCDCMLWWCNVHATHSMQLQVAWPALLHRRSISNSRFILTMTSINHLHIPNSCYTLPWLSSHCIS